MYRDLRHLRDRQSEIGRFDAQNAVEPPARRRRLWPAIVLISLVAATGTVAFLWSQREPETSIDAYRFVPFAVDAGVQSMPAWSPDGQSLAFSGEVDGYYQIFTRRLDQSTASQVTRLPGDCLYPVWDPGGTRIFFQLAPGSGQSLQDTVAEVWMVSPAGVCPSASSAVRAAQPHRRRLDSRRCRWGRACRRWSTVT